MTTKVSERELLEIESKMIDAAGGLKASQVLFANNKIDLEHKLMVHTVKSLKKAMEKIEDAQKELDANKKKTSVLSSVTFGLSVLMTVVAGALMLASGGIGMALMVVIMGAMTVGSIPLGKETLLDKGIKKVVGKKSTNQLIARCVLAVVLTGAGGFCGVGVGLMALTVAVGGTNLGSAAANCYLKTHHIDKDSKKGQAAIWWAFGIQMGLTLIAGIAGGVIFSKAAGASANALTNSSKAAEVSAEAEVLGAGTAEVGSESAATLAKASVSSTGLAEASSEGAAVSSEASSVVDRFMDAIKSYATSVQSYVASVKVSVVKASSALRQIIAAALIAEVIANVVTGVFLIQQMDMTRTVGNYQCKQMKASMNLQVIDQVSQQDQGYLRSAWESQTADPKMYSKFADAKEGFAHVLIQG